MNDCWLWTDWILRWKKYILGVIFKLKLYDHLVYLCSQDQRVLYPIFVYNLHLLENDCSIWSCFMSWKAAKNKTKSMPFQDVYQPFFFIQTLVKDARRPQKRVLRMVIRLFKIMICFNRCCTWEKDQKLIFGSSISVSKKNMFILSLQVKTYLSYYIIEGNRKHDISKLNILPNIKLIHIIFSIQNIYTIVLLPNSDWKTSFEKQ